MGDVRRTPAGTWRARYRDASRRQITRTFRRKRDAQLWLSEAESALAKGTYLDPQAGRLTVGDMAEEWLKNPSWAESTLGRYQTVVRRQVLPAWESTRLDRVTHGDVQAWVNDLSASGLASSTVCKAHVVLSGILELGIRTKRIASNPAAGIRLPRQEVAKRRYLSPSEVQALAEAAGPHSLIVYVLAMTGLRIGELAALTVGSVDLGRRRLMVDRSFTEVHGEGKFSVPKSGERRSVPFPSILDEAMRRQMNMRPRDALLFPSPNGATLRVRNMRRSWFDRAAEEAGLEGLTPHELRHTAASLAVSSGASVLAVQRMLGHEKPSTTLDVYTDLFDADLDAVADGIATSFKDFGTFLVRPE